MKRSIIDLSTIKTKPLTRTHPDMLEELASSNLSVKLMLSVKCYVCKDRFFCHLFQPPGSPLAFPRMSVLQTPSHELGPMNVHATLQHHISCILTSDNAQCSWFILVFSWALLALRCCDVMIDHRWFAAHAIHASSSVILRTLTSFLLNVIFENHTISMHSLLYITHTQVGGACRAA